MNNADAIKSSDKDSESFISIRERIELSAYVLIPMIVFISLSFMEELGGFWVFIRFVIGMGVVSVIMLLTSKGNALTGDVKEYRFYLKFFCVLILFACFVFLKQSALIVYFYCLLMTLVISATMMRDMFLNF